MRSAVQVMVILSPTRANKKYRRNRVAYSFRYHFRTNFVKTNFLPIILKQVVGSDSQCLFPPRPSLQNLRVDYKIVPLKVKF